MTIYEKSLLRDRAKVIYSMALLISQKDNCSFESVLEKLDIPESERPAYLERYSRECNA